MKIYRTTIITKGSFKGWSSNLCSVKVGYKPKKEDFFFIKVWKQQSKDGQWLHPHFSDEQLEIIKKKAKWNYETFVIGDKNSNPSKKIHTNKHHLEDRCERCIELGSYCKNGPQGRVKLQEIVKDDYIILSNNTSLEDDEELAKIIALSDIVEDSLDRPSVGIGDRLEQFQLDRILELTSAKEE
jgi:hypothetical protein